RDRKIEQRDRDVLEARGARDRAEAELAAAFSSLSFRLTAPLRAASRQARRTWRQGRAFADGALRGAATGAPSSRPHPAHGDAVGPRAPGALGQSPPGPRAGSEHPMAATSPRPTAGRHADGPGAREDDPRIKGSSA